MGGGSCLGLNVLPAQAGAFGRYSKAIACLKDINSNQLINYSGEITVIGRWLGISCAYKNTIFGECVPDVEIESIR